MPILIACLDRLRTEFNEMAPDRDKASDGWIGDTAHQNEVSDHNPDETGSVPIHDADKINEVHAVDVDTDFRIPDLTMEKVVQFLLGRCRSGTETRLRYIIYNRRIWEASNDWKQRTYTGSSPHTEHAHFSASYETAKEADTRSWHLEDIPVALTSADKTWIQTQIAAIAGTVWGYPLTDPDGEDGATKMAGTFQRYNDHVNVQSATNAAETVVEAVTPKLDAIKAAIDEVSA